MSDFVPSAVAAGLIMGIVEVFKRAGLPDRLAPALALVLGLGVGVAYYFRPGHEALFDDITVGITVALSACGLYAGARTTLDK